MRNSIALYPFFVVACLVGIGCSDRAVYPISGKVTFQNKPVPAGEIFFDPDASKNNDGPQGHATIKAGVYNTAEGGKGIIGGAYVVRIQGYDGKQANELPLGHPIFETFTQSIDLPKTASTKDFEIP